MAGYPKGLRRQLQGARLSAACFIRLSSQKIIDVRHDGRTKDRRRNAAEILDSDYGRSTRLHDHIGVHSGGIQMQTRSETKYLHAYLDTELNFR